MGESQIKKRATAMLLEFGFEWAAQIRIMLQKHGIDLVHWAASGTGWITDYAEKKPDILIVDLLLPKRDGLYCVQKAAEQNSHCAILLMHSYQGFLANDIELKALTGGAFSVIQKPFPQSRFFKTMDHLLTVVERNRKLRSVKFF